MDTTTTRPTADQLNARLLAGGFVQVTTCTSSTIYRKGNAGWFTESATGHLMVRHGRGSVQLSNGATLVVSIRTGYFAAN